jgi:ADP-ribose pyrophosphatase
LRFPAIVLELLEDLVPHTEPGFLTLVRRRYRARYPDGTASEPFVYDMVDRRALDAVVLAAHYVDPGGVRQVFLRSAVRPPVATRDTKRSPTPEDDPTHGSLWELPAGLVEPEEESRAGLRTAARRELMEELGFEVDVAEFSELGPGTFPVPGIVPERHYYFEVVVEPSRREEPTLDGSALERHGAVVALPLARALDLCRDGTLLDSKTEIGLRRLAERHGLGENP